MADTPPEPPSDLSARKLPIQELLVGSKLFRIHLSAYHAKYFGRSANWRFDDPASSYGTLYAGLRPYVSFAETLLRGRGTTVVQSELATRSLCSFTATRTLKLVSLHGRHLATVGANAAVTAGSYPISQRWSRAFHDHSDRPDGIVYRATHDNDELAVVIFERAAASIDDGASSGLLTNPVMLGMMLDHYQAAIR
ncbi:MAG: RES domain-containing protein [Acetobacteraceae bacterium]|nr:RES domain-containing protein [Acetobacteraceae bacterium]